MCPIRVNITLRNDLFQSQFYYSFIKHINTHCYLHAQLGLGIHFGKRHLQKQQKQNILPEQFFTFGLTYNLTPHTLCSQLFSAAI